MNEYFYTDSSKENNASEFKIDKSKASEFKIDKASELKIDKILGSKMDEVAELKLIHKSEITKYLNILLNKYSGNTYQNDLNELYDIGILIVNGKYEGDRETIVKKLTNIIMTKSKDYIGGGKKRDLLQALQRGMQDGLSDDYRLAYDNKNTYQYNSEKLKVRGHIDRVLNDAT